MWRKKIGRRTWLPRHVCLVASLLLAAAGTFAFLHIPLREWLLASYYEGRLLTGKRDESRESLRRLVTLGGSGMAAAVRALGAPQPTIRELAYQALLEELNHCELQLTPAVSGARLFDMALALAQMAPQAPSGERPRLDSLAMKILALSEAVPLVDRGGVLAACRQVLARDEKSRPPRSVRIESSRTATTAKPHRSIKLPRATHDKPLAQLDLARFSPPALVRADAQTPSEPALLGANDAVALAARAEKPPRAEKREQVQVAAFTVDDESSRAADGTRTAARQLDVIELFNQLHAGAPQAAAARVELGARGFSPREIEVGEHLVSPDAAQRLQWLEWLPGIRGVDARFWLLRLSHDLNGQVRRAAVSLLATDRDPEVIRRLQRVVVEDPDERIRLQAGRALEMLGEP